MLERGGTDTFEKIGYLLASWAQPHLAIEQVSEKLRSFDKEITTVKLNNLPELHSPDFPQRKYIRGQLDYESYKCARYCWQYVKDDCWEYMIIFAK